MEALDAQVLRLADGSKVTIRAIRADDAPMLQSFIRRLSARSRRLRFFSTIVELTVAQLDRLVNVDRRRGLALVALNERSEHEAIIAEARCVLDCTTSSAEFAIAVTDEFQRQGLGMQLMKTLLTYASRKGVRRLFGEVLAENDGMLALARRLGFQIRSNSLDRRTMVASIVASMP